MTSMKRKLKHTLKLNNQILQNKLLMIKCLKKYTISKIINRNNFYDTIIIIVSNIFY